MVGIACHGSGRFRIRTRIWFAMARVGGGDTKFVVSAMAAVVFVLLAPGTVASASGNPSLQAEIVGDPLNHGVSLGSGFLDPFASGIQKAETEAVSGSGASITVAALGWTQTATKPRKLFVVALSAVNWPGQNTSTVDQQTALAAKAAAATTCAGELGSPPKVDVTVRGIPNSHYFQCDRAPDGSVLEGITTARQNVFALAITDTAALSKAKLEAIGLKQYRRLHTPEASLST
jgi:hypothetical protein